MIGSTRQVAVFAYGAPADLRKGFDGLAARVTLELGRDPISGDLFVLVNRSRTRANRETAGRWLRGWRVVSTANQHS